jgi:hypothetical protein
MPIPIAAAAGAVALRALPMIAGVVGRGAAAGATRMGASQGLSKMAGGIAEGQTIRAGVGIVNRMTNSQESPATGLVGPESRNQAFRSGSGPW